MKTEKKKLLIVSNTFPPNNGIGGRRWAKFAKYLNRWEYDIYVFTSENQSDIKSPWAKDVEKLIKENRIIKVKDSYPTILNQYPTSFLKKIQYRLALLFVRLSIKGNYYDRSTLWKIDLLKQLEKKVKKGYTTIIATGAPFRYIHHLLLLKKKYPRLKLIADFRDPWTNNRIAYGFDTLPEKRMNEELVFEKEILQKFDAIVSVDDTHLNHLKTIFDKGNYFVIPNGFDPEDCNIENQEKIKIDKKIRFVYTGTLYSHSEYIFKEFIDTLLELKNSDIELFNQLEFQFFGNKYDSFNIYFDYPELKNTVFHNGTISLEEVYQEIQNADICMLFLTDQMNYTKNTKFYEYIYMRKKIAVFSSEGFLEKYVVENDLGYSMTPGKLKLGLEGIYRNYINKNLKIPTDYDVMQYSIPVILKKYINEVIDKDIV